MSQPILRRTFAEALGSCLLLATVVGSGIMGAKLSGGNVAVALLGNTIPTGAILVVLILTLGAVSGAHMNPLVSLAACLRKEMNWSELAPYALAQLCGAVLGVFAAHLMFDLPVLQVSTHVRTGSGQWIAEAVATFGLIVTILGCVTHARQAVPYAVGLYITAAYWFTASTSFANPAVTIARSFTDTFSGIAPSGIVAFILAQLAGLLMGLLAAQALGYHPQKT